MANSAKGSPSASLKRHVGALAALQNCFESRRNCVLISLVYSTCMYVICSVSWMPSGVNDDWVISNILSGNWPGPQGLCLFVNALLSQAIFTLNQTAPFFNWFFILEGLTTALSFFMLVYLSLSRMPLPCAMLSIGAATILVLPGCTYEANFTYVAGMATAAGFIALSSWLKDRSGSGALVVVGLVLVVIASLWRWNMFLLSLPFYCIVALSIALYDDSATSLINRFSRLWPFAIALMFCGFAYVYDNVSWSQPEWQEWYQFNEARSVYSDYERKPYEEIADELAAIGVSENDYELLNAWIHEDPEFFTAERLDKINEVSKVENNTLLLMTKAAATYLVSLVTAPKMATIFIFALIVALGSLRGRNRKLAIAFILMALAIAVALFVMGRLPARVRYPLWVFAITAFGIASQGFKSTQNSGMLDNSGVYDGIIARASSFATLLLPIIATCFIFASALPHVSLQRLEPIFNAESFEPDSVVVDYILEHPNDVYVVNTSSNSVIMFAHLLIAPYDKDLVSHVISIGGWASRSPYSENRNKEAGMENPIKDLVDNQNAFYLAAGTKSVKLLQTYLREHYYPEAQFEQVAVIDGEKSSTTLYVYKCFSS